MTEQESPELAHETSEADDSGDDAVEAEVTELENEDEAQSEAED